MKRLHYTLTLLTKVWTTPDTEAEAEGAELIIKMLLIMISLLPKAQPDSHVF
jgi:hypothetical protein